MIIGCLLALLIGWSRSYLGDHWPTDILAGWFLAAAMVSITMVLASTMTWRQTGLDLDRTGLLNDERRPSAVGRSHAAIGG
jgi:membrane-associated phospholipid phosphatase